MLPVTGLVGAALLLLVLWPGDLGPNRFGEPPSAGLPPAAAPSLYREVPRRHGHVGPSPDEIAAQPSAGTAARLIPERGVAAVTAPGRPLGRVVSIGLLMTSPENADLAQ